MAFPVSPQPSPGDTYSVENRVWAYDGFGWRFLGPTGSVNVTLSGLNNYTIGNTAPESPTNGDKWYHINDAVEYTFLQDYDSTNHWVEIGYGCPTFGGGTGINFPFTECEGDLYEYDGRTWVYNGYGWKIVCPPDGSEFTFGLTAPDNPAPGHRWVYSGNGLLYTFVKDEDPLIQNGQWVQFGGSDGNLIGPTGPTGDPGPRGATGATGPTGELGDFVKYIFGRTGNIQLLGGEGITLNFTGITHFFKINYATPGVTGLTFATITTASTSDKILLQRKPSDKMELITVGNLLSTAYATVPTDIPGDISSYRFAFFDSSGNQFSSTENNVKNQILDNNINSLNGCTGSVGITGTTGEIEIINSCPNIVIGLPDNVSITGNLTVNGFYFGFIDGGTFE
jgi:hypothetical protein